MLNCKQTLPFMTPNAVKRFWSRVRFRQHGCWEWGACLNHSGYALFSSKRKSFLGHRVAYEQVNGSIPKGLTLDHLCRNRKCVNPAHLEPVTIKENVLRGVGVSVTNAIKTHCPQGHEYTSGNTRIRDGSRECRTCVNERQSAKYHRTKKLKGLRSHCKNGHLFSIENTRLDKHGHRKCRECHRIEENRRYHSKVKFQLARRIA